MTKVYVYYNLHKHCWSVRERGKVIAHLPSLTLEDVTFKVSLKGRERVLREQRKNVHAFAVGVLKPALIVPPDALRISYNPYRSSFFETSQGVPVHAAGIVAFTEDGKVYLLKEK